ncbi:hypothetical protein ANCCAN_09689 [Ancylostoma caninum]|uniref:Uncharacterized protein n=1 Tax=Ancylostoma caninum TaxID=29170 RepID=A0A368GMY2_ANCCA|nr:hypothetical protein ANCCAN_09689 [Ancylostoma caninum]
MDGCGQMQPRMGTPTNVMHIQQGTIGSPSVGSAPMTPQQMIQQQGLMQGQQTPTGQYDQAVGFPQQQQQQQMPQGYPQGISESPGALHMQQQQMMGSAGGQDDGSATDGHDGRNSSAVLCSTKSTSTVDSAAATDLYLKMPGKAGLVALLWKFLSNLCLMQQAHFVRQPQVIGGAPGQRVMIQRVPYPPGTGKISIISQVLDVLM